MHDEPAGIRFALVGKLDDQELQQLEASFRTAESVRRGREMIVDARKLDVADESTQVLLERLRASGATLLTADAAPAPGAGYLKRLLCQALRAREQGTW